MDNVIWCRRSEESLVPSQLNHRPWAQFGALAFLLLFLTFFNGVLLLFLFLRQLILSSCHNSNLLSSIGFSLSKSSWWGDTDHVGNFHLIPYQNASLVHWSSCSREFCGVGWVDYCDADVESGQLVQLGALVTSSPSWWWGSFSSSSSNRGAISWGSDMPTLCL